MLVCIKQTNNTMIKDCKFNANKLADTLGSTPGHLHRKHVIVKKQAADGDGTHEGGLNRNTNENLP